jgi:hypothetical protein
MSDYDDNDDLETTDEAPKRNWRRDLEEQAAQAKAAAAEAEAARRELAFLKAGIDLDSPQGKLLAKGYDGPATAEAIKAAAVEYGLIQTEAPAVPAEELAAHDRVANASAGAPTANEADELMAELDKAGDFFSGSPDAVMAVLRKAGISAEYSRPGNWQRTDASQPL